MGVVAASRHPSLYFEDGTIVLRVGYPRVSPSIPVTDYQCWQVQGVIFKVHRHFLTEYSPVFKDMRALGSIRSSNGEGSSDDNPVFLNGDDPEDFGCLLQLFYHK